MGRQIKAVGDLQFPRFCQAHLVKSPQLGHLRSHTWLPMSVPFTCPHCGQLLTADIQQVGHPVRCTRCQGGVLVPDSPAAVPGGNSSLATALPPDDTRAAARRTTHGHLELSRPAIYTIGGLLAGIAILAFLLGWAFGSRFSTSQRASVSSSPTLDGRISYLTQRGKHAPDTESVVIAFSTTRKPDEKMPAGELRPDIPAADVATTTRSTVRAWGGDFARCDRSGAYEIEVDKPGEYYLLVISNHRSRDADRPLTTREVVEIGQFVTRATELLQDNDFVWTKQVIGPSTTFDHLFGARP